MSPLVSISLSSPQRSRAPRTFRGSFGTIVGPLADSVGGTIHFRTVVGRQPDESIVVVSLVVQGVQYDTDGRVELRQARVVIELGGRVWRIAVSGGAARFVPGGRGTVLVGSDDGYVTVVEAYLGEEGGGRTDNRFGVGVGVGVRRSSSSPHARLATDGGRGRGRPPSPVGKESPEGVGQIQGVVRGRRFHQIRHAVRSGRIVPPIIETAILILCRFAVLRLTVMSEHAIGDPFRFALTVGRRRGGKFSIMPNIMWKHQACPRTYQGFFCSFNSCSYHLSRRMRTSLRMSLLIQTTKYNRQGAQICLIRARVFILF
mmetsp:Transcript_21787/g.64227  ORF Transcript_21787/g.64227 Transcript_21787/m.64227 type:complete len:316 (-) Transcript_21787:48-995(-)